MAQLKITAVAAVALVLAACSGGATWSTGRRTTTVKLTPGFHYVDCRGIEPGDPMDIAILEMPACEPKDEATIHTVDCTDGTYVYLRRPGADLEGIVGRTEWRAAGPTDPDRAKTSFATTECREGDY